MDDKHIEDMLRNTLRPTLPDGMRDRTLKLARQQASRHTKYRIPGMSRWRVGFAALGITIIAFTGICDHRRGERIAVMVGGNSLSIDSPAPGDSFMKMRQEVHDTLAHVPVGRCSQDGSKGGDSL